MTKPLRYIRPARGLRLVDLRLLWAYRDLVLLFARRDLKVRYSRTFLGPLWLLVEPLALSAVGAVLISGVAKVATGSVPAALFYPPGLIIWSYFTQVTKISWLFIENEQMFSKVYFPRLVMPLASLISAAVGMAIQVLTLVLLLLGLQMTGGFDGLTWRALLFPLVFLQLSAVTLGAGLIVCSTTALYRDLTNALPLLIQIGILATPIFYPLSAVPEQFRSLFCFINPLAVSVDAGRWCLLGEGSLSAGNIVAALASTALLLAAGLALFYRVERSAVDTV